MTPDAASLAGGIDEIARNRTRSGAGLSIVIPVFNEAKNLLTLHNRICEVAKHLRDQRKLACEVVYVDDGSRDATLAVARDLRPDALDVQVISLSRNFGKEAALLAGLDHARLGAVLFMDGDGQHSPALVETLVGHWLDGGFDVVYTAKAHRENEPWLRRAAGRGFYAMVNWGARQKIPADAGDFRLLSPRAAAALRQLPERNRFFKGLASWIGFRQLRVDYEPEERTHGRSNWNIWALLGLSIEGLTSFSVAPLRLASLLGLLLAGAALIFGIQILVETVLFGQSVPGYPSVVVGLMVLGGVQLIMIGIMGEYIGKILSELKARPVYFVAEHTLKTAEDAGVAGSENPHALLLNNVGGIPEPSSVRRRIWLCADDYGISESVDIAIRDLVVRGRLNATSVMMVAPSMQKSEAAALDRLNAGQRRVAIGLHVTLTVPFRPASKSFAPLRKGQFLPLSIMLGLACLGRLQRDALMAEIGEQLRLFVEKFGRPPDFIDGHQHVHLFPQVRDAVLTLAKERAPGAWLRQCGRMQPLQKRLHDRKGLLLDFLSQGFRQRAEALGVRTNPAFAGTYSFGRNITFADVFPHFLDRLPDGSVVMCHPGFVDEELRRLDPLTSEREREFAFFADDEFPALLERHGLELA